MQQSISKTLGAFTRNLLFVLALVCALALATTARSDEPAPSRGIDFSQCESAEFASTCLNLLLAYRCEQYAFPMTALATGCVQASARFTKTLDLKIVPVTLPTETGESKEYALKLIFAAELEKLVRDPEAQTFIIDLEYDLRRAIRARTSFSIWERAISVAQGDRGKALRWLAVFLQDTSWTQLPVKFLESKNEAVEYTGEEWQTIQKLKSLLTMLEPAALLTADAVGIAIYPDAKLEREMNRSLYHFYPMALQAFRLASEGQRAATFVPFLFNANYEFQDLDPARWPLQHPAPFELSNSNRHRRQDIYLGLAGARFGAKGEMSGLESFETFSKDLARSPFRAMQKRFLREAAL